MLKIILGCIVAAVIIIGAISTYHMHRVNAKNEAEMAKFTTETPLKTDLGKVLIVYYSLSGRTKDIARQIADKTHGELYEIKTVKEYSSPSVYAESKKELSSGNYPGLRTDNLPNVTEYDTVFIGGPVWWYTMAPPLYSFLKQTSLDGVRVVPFSTQGSNYGQFFADFKANAKGAQILPSESFNNMSAKYKPQISNKINVWLNKLSR